MMPRQIGHIRKEGKKTKEEKYFSGKNNNTKEGSSKIDINQRRHYLLNTQYLKDSQCDLLITVLESRRNGLTAARRWRNKYTSLHNEFTSTTEGQFMLVFVTTPPRLPSSIRCRGDFAKRYLSIRHTSLYCVIDLTGWQADWLPCLTWDSHIDINALGAIAF